MAQLQTIGEVLKALDNIILRCFSNSSRMGYFAVLYRRMTLAIQQSITAGAFEDPVRMERLDVIFAQRYIDAFEQFWIKKKVTRSWQKTFDAAGTSKLTVIQHLLLGINTHINLDLAIAAAATSPGASIHAMQRDFDKVNDIIGNLIDEMQDKLARVWWPMKLLDRITNDREEAVINFSITAARKASWANAIGISTVTELEMPPYVDGIDNVVAGIGDRIINPGMMINFMLTQVKWFEYSDIRRNIELLK